MENIIIKKIWSDIDFYQVEIMFVSQKVSCISETYVMPENIVELSNAILLFIKNPNCFINWSLGEKGSDANPKIEIDFKLIDKMGHVAINIYSDILTLDGDKDYSCHFPILTELGMLKSFGEKLLILNDSEIGCCIALVNTE